MPGRRLLPVLFTLANAGAAAAQPDLFDTRSVRDIRLRFEHADWRRRLDSLYLLGNDARLTGDLWIDGTHLPGVGVRFKGYSSYNPAYGKNPLNIDLDHTHPQQDFQGRNKLKLANITSDPSHLREALSYELARCYLPASRANYATVTVNDTLLGLYTNVEDVGGGFLEEHFGWRGGSFFKGNPPVVDLTGENCSLSDNPGTDSSAYQGLYTIQSEHGWQHLLELIDVLNNDPERAEDVLNVDRALWMHAFNYALINFDSYVGYAQNYYLYRDREARWNTIPWDLNMSFASFRLTDASTYWNGFSIAQAITMDPLMHHHSVSVFPRPLMRNLFANATWRRMYLAHLRTIVREWVGTGLYRQRAEELQASIAPHVAADPNKFFSYTDFLANLEEPIYGITSYPGLVQLMEQRAAWLETYPGFTGEPVIGEPACAPATITVGQPLIITAPVSGADTVVLAYRFGANGSVFHRVPMLDDGQHGDGAAGDGVYGAAITAEATVVRYYLYAENQQAGAFSPARAAHETHIFQTRLAPGALVINELMAGNEGIVTDASGRSPDWIELHNAGGFAVSTAGLFLSDDPAHPTKWPLPLRTLPPGGYLTLWADGDPDAGEDHTNFRLERNGEHLLLAYDDTTVIDRVDFGQQYPIYSTGRLPNGTGAFRLLPPTFNAMNQVGLTSNVDRPLLVYPNPATTQVNIIAQVPPPFEVQLFSSDGRAMNAALTRHTAERIALSTIGLDAGHYIVQVRTADALLSQPFIVIP